MLKDYLKAIFEVAKQGDAREESYYPALNDRKKRILSTEDIKHYCRVVTGLARTMDIQAEIDRLYPGVEESVIR